MKKVLLVFVFLGVTLSLAALDADFSFSYQPFVFASDLADFYGDKEHKDYDKGQQLVYQGRLKFRSGFNFGFGIKYDSGYDINDNLVGHFADILGYAGFKRFSVRVARLLSPGTIEMKEIPGEGQPPSKRFEDTRTSVDLLYTIYSMGVASMYAGLKYTYYDIAGVDWFEDGAGIKGAYHTNYSGGAYGVIWGVDSMPDILSNREGFDVSPWAEVWVSFVIGSASGKTEDGKTTDVARALLDYHTEGTLGIMVTGGKKIRFGLAAGYMGEMGVGFLYHGFNMRLGLKI